jgi:TPR repeat protein
MVRSQRARKPVQCFRHAFITVLTVLLPAFADQADDSFQRGVTLYQSGNRAAAVQAFIKAAKAGDAKAAVQVGWCYESGDGTRQDLAEAAKWYRTGAERGNSRGQKNLGAMYEEGRGLPEDWVQAAKWYAKSAAQGDPDGQAALARAYQFGIGVPQSRGEAIAWDERAAAAGNAEAAYYVRWLSSPSNNIGFRNASERNRVIGFRMVDVIVLNEPAGTVFRNSGERNAYLMRVAQRLSSDETYSRWWMARAEFTQCQSAHRSGCRDPGPRP